MILKGNLHVVNINRINKIDDPLALKIFGVRIAKFLPSGWVHRQGLTPSKTLLFKSKELERKKTWNTLSFNEYYLPNYLKEISNNNTAYEEIDEIAQALNRGINVYYACYCNDVSICHRSIVGDIFERNGYNVSRS